LLETTTPFNRPPPLADSETSGLQIILIVPEVLRTLNRYETEKKTARIHLEDNPFSRAYGTLKLCATVKLTGSSHLQLQKQPQIPMYLKSLEHGADVQQTSLTAPIHFEDIPHCATAARNIEAMCNKIDSQDSVLAGSIVHNSQYTRNP
jgi:hypothetical protein